MLILMNGVPMMSSEVEHLLSVVMWPLCGLAMLFPFIDGVTYVVVFFDAIPRWCLFNTFDSVPFVYIHIFDMVFLSVWLLLLFLPMYSTLGGYSKGVMVFTRWYAFLNSLIAFLGGLYMVFYPIYT